MEAERRYDAQMEFAKVLRTGIFQVYKTDADSLDEETTEHFEKWLNTKAFSLIDEAERFLGEDGHVHDSEREQS